MSSSLLKQYLSGPAEIGGGGCAAPLYQSNKTSHAPSSHIQDGSPSKKRSCDEQVPSISNKKVKESDTDATLQYNNNEVLPIEVSIDDTTKDIMVGAPTEQSMLHSAVSDTSLQLQSKADEDEYLLSEEVVSILSSK